MAVIEKISKIIAKIYLKTFPHTWTKGLDYELIEYEDYITLASNEGNLNYVDEVKDEILSMFYCRVNIK